MALADFDLTLAADITRNLAWIFFYLAIGLGPGFLAGLLISNRIWGRRQPKLTTVHQENMEAAAAHNKQFDPEHPRWSRV